MREYPVMMSKIRITRLVFLALLITSCAALTGQGRVPDFNSGQFNGQQNNTTINPADTIERPDLTYTSFLLSALRSPISNLDTFVNEIHTLEPQYKTDFIRPNLGPDISASQDHPWYVPEEGVRHGHHLFDQVFRSTAAPEIVKVNRSFAEVHMMQQGSGFGRHLGASSFSAKFYRSFARKILLNFNYKSMSDDGDAPLFGTVPESQASSMRRLDLKMSQESKHGNRVTYIHYDRPTVSQNINRDYYASTDIVSLAQSRRSIVIGNSWVSKDSINAPEKYRLESKLSFVKDDYSSSSNDLSVNGSNFTLLGLTDDRLDYANSASTARLTNELFIPVGSGHLQTGIDIAKINHRLGSIDSSSFFQAILTAGFYKPFSDRLTFSASGRLGLLDASGLAVLKGKVDYKANDNLELEATGVLKRTIPSLMRQRLIVNDTIYQESSWGNIEGTAFSIASFYKPTSTNVDFSFETFSNLFTINSRGFFEQIGSRVSLLSMQAKQHLDIGPFYTEHALKFQAVSDDRFSVPNFNYTGDIYLQFHMFKKKMLTRMGADVYFIPFFDLPEFYAVTGEFYNSTQANGNSVIILNPYLNAKVGPFHIFVKGMDLLHRLRPTRRVPIPGTDRTLGAFDYPLVTGLPRHDFKVRFGIKWTLLD